jgi:hypothetical protein
MNEVDTSKLVWPELAQNSRYSKLLKSIALFKEWEKALANYNRSASTGAPVDADLVQTNYAPVPPKKPNPNPNSL